MAQKIEFENWLEMSIDLDAENINWDMPEIEYNDWAENQDFPEVE